VFGIPIPKDMTSRALKEILEEGSTLAKKEIQYQEVDKKERIRERARELKALGRDMIMRCC
jgi:hypothetical protein